MGRSPISLKRGKSQESKKQIRNLKSLRHKVKNVEIGTAQGVRIFTKRIQGKCQYRKR